MMILNIQILKLNYHSITKIWVEDITKKILRVSMYFLAPKIFFYRKSLEKYVEIDGKYKMPCIRCARRRAVSEIGMISRGNDPI